MKIMKRGFDGKSNSSFYGHLDKQLNNNLNANDYFSINNKTQPMSMTLERINGERVIDAIVYAHKTPNGVMKRISEQTTVRDEETFESERSMLESYERIISLTSVEEIMLDSFFEEFKDRLSKNYITAYKKFVIQNTKNIRHSVYIYHFFALLISTLALLNDVDFEVPIYIAYKRKGDILNLSIRLVSKNHLGIKDKWMLRSIQGIEAKLAYIAALCRVDDINSTFKFTKNSLTIEYSIYNVVREKRVLYSRSDEKEQMFNELMDLFNYRGREVQEEE